MTFTSAIFDKRVRISSWIPSAKYAFSLSLLRFSNGKTAMLFSGIAVGVEACATAPTLACAGLKKPKYKPPTASASKQSDASARARTLFFDRGKNGLTDDRRASGEGIGNLRAISVTRSEEHTSELQSLRHLVCRLLLEKKKKKNK